jgi:hypothetical protein
MDDLTGFLLLVWVASKEPQNYPKVYHFPNSATCSTAKLALMPLLHHGVAVCAEISSVFKIEPLKDPL